MTISNYIKEVCKGNIPEESPDDLKQYDYRFIKKLDDSILKEYSDTILKDYSYRSICTERGMWCLVSKDWLKELAIWIGKRSVLEIMAGAGYIAKGLSECDIDIKATDNLSWNKAHKHYKEVFPIEKLSAIDAVKKYEMDILLVSWPPYEDSMIDKVCKLWGPKRPIIYIGEQYGCTGTDEFWNHFQICKDVPTFPFKRWDTIHDNIYIGYYK